MYYVKINKNDFHFIFDMSFHPMILFFFKIWVSMKNKLVTQYIKYGREKINSHQIWHQLKLVVHHRWYNEVYLHSDSI